MYIQKPPTVYTVFGGFQTLYLMKNRYECFSQNLFFIFLIFLEGVSGV